MKAIATLDSFLSLEAGWDGYSAPSIDPAAIENAKNLIPFIDYGIEVFPTGIGSVQIEFSVTGIEVELEIGANVAFEFLSGKKDVHNRWDIVNWNDSHFKKWLSDVIERAKYLDQ